MEVVWGDIKPNNIYNVDCYEAIKKIPNNSVDLIYIDIPYDLEGNGGGGGSKKRDYHKEYEKVSQNSNASGLAKRKSGSSSSIAEIAFGIDWNILDEFVRIQKNINIYIWCSKKQILHLMKFFIEEHDCFFDILVWCKSNPIPTCNNTYLSDLEYCLHFRNGVSVGGTYETKSKYYVSPLNKGDKDLYNHPTIKPLELVKNHIINSSKEGDIVLDCFLGSGTTAVACQSLNRKYIGFELNPEYFAIARDRLNGITQIERKQKDAGIMNIFDFIEEE